VTLARISKLERISDPSMDHYRFATVKQPRLQTQGINFSPKSEYPLPFDVSNDAKRRSPFSERNNNARDDRAINAMIR